MKKRCTKCKQLRSLDEFTKNKDAKDGLQWTCKICAKEYYQTHKIKIIGYKKKYEQSKKGKLSIRKHNLKNKFNITLGQYDQMLEKQNGVCAICGELETAKDKYGGMKRLAVDHNHKTDKIRALLCNNCNNMIGYAKENIIYLESAINYLKSHKT